jgi:assimilatory nitrate reductase catalytic subunit
MATNPAVSLPRAGAMRAALRKLELFVVSENVLSNDTVNAGAQILLPAAAWGEKDGTVTNSERRISRQRAFLPLPGEARPDWWIVSQVARRMGFEQAFAYRSAADVFREHAALSAFENSGTRDFDLGGLADLSNEEFDALEPVQWPVRQGEARGERRFFAQGEFFTLDGKACFVPPAPPVLRERASAAYPFRLNTGRIRDQWHRMTRTGLSPRLASHQSEPFVEIHPTDAAASHLADGDFAKISTVHGACVLTVRVRDSQRPGSLFMPIHWSGETASGVCAGDLIAPHTDAHSGQPEAKATPAAITPVTFAAHGLARARQPILFPKPTWWVRVAVAGGTEYRLATNDGPMMWHDLAHRVLAGDGSLAEELEGASYRAAAFTDGELDAYLCIVPAGTPLNWNPQTLAPVEQTTGAVFTLPQIDFSSGDAESVVCACFQVKESAIREAVSSGAARTVGDIGRILRAGSNCGSCLPELRALIRS